MDFELTIIGSNSAVPAHGRFPTSQLLKHHNQRYLIDCGEGTQFRMSYHKVKRSHLDHIFISHLHGDHYFGLVGLINTMRMSGRKQLLHVYGPEELKCIIELQVDLKNPDWGFEIEFHPLNKDVHECIYENNVLEVWTIPLDHKEMTCNGFLFKEKTKPRRIIASAIQEYEIPYDKINDIRYGSDFTDSKGVIHPNEKLTDKGAPSKSYAYCSDTKYSENILPYIQNVTLLYHEATFMEAEREKAEERYHSTAKQAAAIAVKAKVDKLLIGHYSARYANLTPLLEEAKAVFSNTELAHEGFTFVIS